MGREIIVKPLRMRSLKMILQHHLLDFFSSLYIVGYSGYLNTSVKLYDVILLLIESEAQLLSIHHASN